MNRITKTKPKQAEEPIKAEDFYSTPLPPLKGYALWLLPAPSARFSLDRVIHRLAAKLGTPSFTPHLTIASVTDDQLHTVGEMLPDLAAELTKHSLSAGSLQVSDNPYQKLHLQIEPDDLLTQFYTTLASKLKLDVKSDNPHISLLYGSVDEEKLSAISGPIFEELPEIVLFDTLALVELHGTPNNWKIISSKKLSSK